MQDRPHLSDREIELAAPAAWIVIGTALLLAAMLAGLICGG